MRTFVSQKTGSAVSKELLEKTNTGENDGEHLITRNSEIKEGTYATVWESTAVMVGFLDW